MLHTPGWPAVHWAVVFIQQAADWQSALLAQAQEFAEATQRPVWPQQNGLDDGQAMPEPNPRQSQTWVVPLKTAPVHCLVTAPVKVGQHLLDAQSPLLQHCETNRCTTQTYGVAPAGR